MIKEVRSNQSKSIFMLGNRNIQNGLLSFNDNTNKRNKKCNFFRNFFFRKWKEFESSFFIFICIYNTIRYVKVGFKRNYIQKNRLNNKFDICKILKRSIGLIYIIFITTGCINNLTQKNVNHKSPKITLTQSNQISTTLNPKFVSSNQFSLGKCVNNFKKASTLFLGLVLPQLFGSVDASSTINFDNNLNQGINSIINCGNERIITSTNKASTQTLNCWDADLDSLWSMNLGFNSLYQGTDLLSLSDDKFLNLGYTLIDGKKKIVISEIECIGTIDNVFLINGTGSYFPKTMAKNSSENVIIGGIADVYQTLDNPFFINYVSVGEGDNSARLVNNLVLNLSESSEIKKIILSQDNNFLFSGNIGNNILFGKTNSDLDIQFIKSVGGSGVETAETIIEGANGNIIPIGYSLVDENKDIITPIHNSLGEKKSTKFFGFPNYDNEIFEAYVDSSENWILGGYTTYSETSKKIASIIKINSNSNISFAKGYKNNECDSLIYSLGHDYNKIFIGGIFNSSGILGSFDDLDECFKDINLNEVDMTSYTTTEDTEIDEFIHELNLVPIFFNVNTATSSIGISDICFTQISTTNISAEPINVENKGNGKIQFSTDIIIISGSVFLCCCLSSLSLCFYIHKKRSKELKNHINDNKQIIDDNKRSACDANSMNNMDIMYNNSLKTSRKRPSNQTQINTSVEMPSRENQNNINLKNLNFQSRSINTSQNIVFGDNLYNMNNDQIEYNDDYEEEKEGDYEEQNNNIPVIESIYALKNRQNKRIHVKSNSKFNSLSGVGSVFNYESNKKKKEEFFNKRNTASMMIVPEEAEHLKNEKIRKKLGINLTRSNLVFQSVYTSKPHHSTHISENIIVSKNMQKSNNCSQNDDNSFLKVNKLNPKSNSNKSRYFKTIITSNKENDENCSSSKLNNSNRKNDKEKSNDLLNYSDDNDKEISLHLIDDSQHEKENSINKLTPLSIIINNEDKLDDEKINKDNIETDNK